MRGDGIRIRGMGQPDGWREMRREESERKNNSWASDPFAPSCAAAFFLVSISALFLSPLLFSSPCLLFHSRTLIRYFFLPRSFES